MKLMDWLIVLFAVITAGILVEFLVRRFPNKFGYFDFRKRKRDKRETE